MIWLLLDKTSKKNMGYRYDLPDEEEAMIYDIFEVEREAGIGEEFNHIDSCWVVNENLLREQRNREIDATYLESNGDLAIELIHIRKVIESNLILAGINITQSIVKQEADLMNISAEELANLIILKDKNIVNKEIDRRREKIENG